jgi:hypothetical protein
MKKRGLSMIKSLKFSADSPLNELDSDNQTFGCRHRDPEFCKYIDNKDVCAFVRSDCVCKKPSTSWKKNYKKLIDIQTQAPL